MSDQQASQEVEVSPKPLHFAEPILPVPHVQNIDILSKFRMMVKVSGKAPYPNNQEKYQVVPGELY